MRAILIAAMVAANAQALPPGNAGEALNAGRPYRLMVAINGTQRLTLDDLTDEECQRFMDGPLTSLPFPIETAPHDVVDMVCLFVPKGD